MAEDPDIQQKADELLSLARADPNACLSNIIICMYNSCTFLTAFIQDKGEEGWSARVVDDNGDPLLEEADQQKIEETFANAPWLADILMNPGTAMPKRKRRGFSQKGGAPKLPKLAVTGTTVKGISALGFGITGADVSLDKMFQKLLDSTSQADELFTKISMESPGFLKLIYDHPGIPMPGFPAIMIPLPPLVLLAVKVIDSIRLSTALAGEKNTALTVLILLEELLTGQWRQMLLTSLGFISPTGVAAGVILKYIVNAWVLINPELRDDIARDMYKATKSLLIGFLLWAGTTLPPTAVKIPMKLVLKQFTDLVANAEEKIHQLEETASRPLKPIGKKLQFTGVDLDKFKSLTIEDIQNLQSFAQWDLLVCTQEFQDILKSIEQNPILRLLVELLNVPTLPEDTYKICHTDKFISLEERIEEAFTPIIVDDPTAEEGGQKGGGNGASKRYRKTRGRRGLKARGGRATRKASIWH